MTLTRERVEEPVERELSLELQEQLQEHPGKWVAMTRDRLIAVADSPGEALEQARAAGEESPMLYKVPAASQTFFF